MVSETPRILAGTFKAAEPEREKTAISPSLSLPSARNVPKLARQTCSKSHDFSGSAGCIHFKAVLNKVFSFKTLVRLRFQVTVDVEQLFQREENVPELPKGDFLYAGATQNIFSLSRSLSSPECRLDLFSQLSRLSLLSFSLL